jgi:arylsulfatase A-like enzyme
MPLLSSDNRQMINTLLKFYAGSLLCLLLPAGLAADTRPPNILLIMADDLGYNDLHIYNGNPLARTPTIDGLAREGVRFTRHYTDTVCEPSRIALLTGQFPARLGGRAGPRGISADVITIADSLQAAGYRTHHVGKWHVRRRIRDAWPDRQGFQTYFGFINQLLLDGRQVNGRHAYGKSRYHNPWLSVDGGPAREYEGHLTELLVKDVVQSIKSFRSEQPWFINFWPLAPHLPTEPAAEWGKRYPPTREGQYFALIEQLDDGVRRILETLEQTGQRDNTVVVFTSDNGGANLGTDNNAPLNGHKLQYNEGGVRTPLIMRWPGHFATDLVVDQPVALVDLFPTLASIAGARYPVDLDGLDIQPAIHGTRLPPRAQYYERFHQGRYGFTVLSADGRWRLYVPEPRGNFALLKVPGEPILYDLWQDPFGWKNIYAQHPEVVAQLEEEHRRWHRRAREIRVTSTPVKDRGLTLTGDDMQRTPGYGGFTFAVGYFPPESGETPHGTVAAQRNAWTLAVDDSGTNAKLMFGEYQLSAALTSLQGCNSLVATAHFKITTLRPSEASNLLTMALYHNGKMVGERNIKGISEGFEDTHVETTVGYSAESDGIFKGKLGTPVLLNSYTSATTPVTPADLHAELCPKS